MYGQVLRAASPPKRWNGTAKETDEQPKGVGDMIEPSEASTKSVDFDVLRTMHPSVVFDQSILKTSMLNDF